MNDTRKPKKGPKRHIADVQAPGTSAPSETSRPVIVTNRPLLKDPMVVGEKDGGTDEKPSRKPPETLSSSAKPELRPLDNSITPDEASSEPDTQDPKAPDAEQQPLADETETVPPPEAVPENPAAQAASNADSVSEPDVPTEDTPARADDQVAADAPKSAVAKKADAAAAEQAKRDAALRKLVDSKQYTLPINATEKRQTKRFVLLGIGLSVLLALIWLDIALDAGIIKLGGLRAPTHFFSN